MRKKSNLEKIEPTIKHPRLPIPPLIFLDTLLSLSFSFPC